ncbi:MAG: 4Fe-4S dicluster domain-containing protein [Burkholderiaceae bacterium]
MRLFSTRHRPFHLGPYPLERLAREPGAAIDFGRVPPMRAPAFERADALAIVHAIRPYLDMFDVVRDGAVAALRAEIPDDPAERARHLKAAGYYFDASMMGACALPREALLAEPVRNPRLGAIAAELERSQPQSFAAGMDMILADVKDSARAERGPITAHTHALVVLVAWPRDPRPGEPGCDWIADAQAERAAVLAAQTAVLLATYLRLLGFEARSHSATCTDVDLNRLAVAAGLAHTDLHNPYLGTRYGLAAVSTACAIAPDAPLAVPEAQQRARTHGLRWQLGIGSVKGAWHNDPFARRDFRLGPHPFETLPRRAEPTTFIDHERVPRFPKRADFFARALFGDLGRDVQEGAKNAHYVMKSPIGACARRALGALLLLQFGEARGPVSPTTADAQRNADNVKAAAYWLGIDATGLCAIPRWAWYSHDAGGNAMPAYDANAINLLIDQGYETMAGASGDDWISVAQSMRAYLRFSLLGGILAEQIRRLGYSARVHSVLDGDLLQPGLLLLSGLGEVSRIGEVILNPFLGPRLKSGTVSTDLPMRADAPIDFGLQRFCEQCSKCARECPSGAITAGPKLVYNGYEIWKSDAEKCARYRITNAGGGMCGRCMKTCPWNTEGLLADRAWRWAASRFGALAPALAARDDRLGRGGINAVKAWWWDIELDRSSGAYVRAKQTHRRGLNTALRIDAAAQSLAVYPADTMPPPFPVAHPVNREQGIARYRALLTPAQYRERLGRGDTAGLAPPFVMPAGEPPVFALRLARREEMTPDIARFELVAPGGGELPPFDAGAHIDVVIAPEYLRQFSLAGDPRDRRTWVLGVQREPHGRGGSALMHRAFRAGRTVFVSKPRNHFALHENATRSLLFAGGIGVTPLLAMAHRLHALGREFELHFSAASKANAAFMSDLEAAPWRERVRFHFKAEGRRAELPRLVPPHAPGMHLYCCGSPRYMDAVFDAARAAHWPDEALHREYFQLPEAPPRENHPFTLKLLASGRTLEVPADRAATEVLAEAGGAVDTKCSDGLCGVCALAYDAAASGPIDHRDHVLGEAARRERVVLCCSRAAEPGGVIALRC